jgi:hypothetical protein
MVWPAWVVQALWMVAATIISIALAPRPPRPKSAALEDFQVPTAEEGRAIPVVFGTIRITGPNVIWYGDLSKVPITQSSLFSSTTIGYRYNIGLHFALCFGPVDAFLQWDWDDKAAWTGNATSSGLQAIDEPRLFGGKKSEGGVQGTFWVRMGEDTQPVDPYLLANLGAPLPAYRGLLSIVWHGGYIGRSQYIKPVAFVVRRTAAGWQGDTWYPAAVTVDGGMNPAHIIYEVLTNSDFGYGEPTTSINEASFTAAADTFVEENFGLNFQWVHPEKIEEFLGEVCSHAGMVLGQDPTTGKYTLTLLRDNYEADDLELIDESSVIELIRYARQGFGEVVNELSVSYTDPDSYKSTIITVQDLGSIRAQGGVVSQQVDFSGIRNHDVAKAVAARELAMRSTSLGRGTIRCSRRAWALQQGDVFRFTWEKEGISESVHRVMAIRKGTLEDGSIEIDIAQDVFGLSVSSYTTPIPVDAEPTRPPEPDDETSSSGTVESTTTTTPPGSPADGDTYYVPTGATGAWSGHDGEVAVWDEDEGAWQFVDVGAGTLIYDTGSATWVVLNADGTTSAAPWEADGISLAGKWRFDTSTTAADPGTGDVRFNSATPAAVTALYLSQTSRPGTDYGHVLELLASGSQLVVQDRTDAAKYIRATLSGTPTDNGAWWTLPVAINASGTLPAANVELAVVFATGGGSSGVTDHGALTGLADDDHTQYHTDARGDARYYTKTAQDATDAAQDATLAAHLADPVDAHDASAISYDNTDSGLVADDVKEAIDELAANGGGPSIHGQWRFDPSTTSSDPGSGDLRFNSATPASVTEIYIHELNRAGSDCSRVFAFLEAGTQMLFQQRLDATRFIRVELSAAPTDNGAWWTLPVTVISSGLLPQTNTDVSVVLFIGGGGGPGGPVDAEDVTYDNTTSGLAATDVQAAIDEVVGLLGETAATGNYLISGGGVAWTSGLSFLISAANYVIAGTEYNSPETTVTLATADATNPRIDVIIVDDTSTASVVTGTPAATPERPDVDPASELELSFVYVPAAASTPGVTVEPIYRENVEWTTSTSGGTINVASTNNPYAGTKDVEGTSVANGHYVQFQKGSTFDPATYNSLILHIRSKAAWPSQKSLSLTLRENGAQRGTAITVKTGTFSFDSANTTSYQQIVIPVSSFAAGGLSCNQLRIAVIGSSSAIGFYIDNVELQAGVMPPVPGATDHGALTGLADDDHTQYLTTGRHAAIDAADHGSGAAASGLVLAADGAGGAAWVSVGVAGGFADIVQVNDLVITSNASYQDTELSTTLVAGTYAVECYFRATTNATPGMSLELSYSGTVTKASALRLLFSSSGGNPAAEIYTTMPMVASMGLTAGYQHVIHGTLVVSTSGTLKVRAKQNTSSGTSVTFWSGSRLHLRRIG